MFNTTELFNLAVSHHQKGDLAQAESLYRQIIQGDPSHADAFHFLGILKQDLGFGDEAIALIRQAIELAPASAAYPFSLGNILMGLGKSLEAMECYRQALRIDPRHAVALYNLGTAHLNDRQLAEAGECFRKALLIQPNYIKAHINLGNVRKEQGNLPEAAECFRQALHLAPASIEAINNLGSAYFGQELLAEAAECFRQALALNPGDNLALWNQALLRMTQEDFTDVWPDFEMRWDLPNWPPPAYHGPRWDGSPLAGKTILVFYEQGFGDTIQFIRYLPLVKKRGGTVLFACQPALRQVLAGIEGVDHFLEEGAQVPAYDVQIPLMSLPGIFQTTMAHIPPVNSYLSAMPELVEQWRQELMLLTSFNREPTVAFGSSPLNIGIAWQGNPKAGGDRLRSIPLEYFEPVARLPGVRLISLQKRPGAEQIHTLPRRFPIVELGDRLESFCDTAAVMKNLDLIITSDTAIAHLAGALGVPVWTVLHLVPDWRWFLGRSDCPWYPTMRLFRQRRLGDWAEVFQRIADALRQSLV